MDDGFDPRCPACGAIIGDASECPGCALPIGGREEAQLRALRASVASLDAQIRQLDERRRELRGEIHRRVLARPVAAPAAPAAPAAHAADGADALWPDPGAELDTEHVRNVLLSLGTALLALAALAFTAVAWARFGDGGRAALLVGLTVMTVALAGAVRRRLPATAEALSALAITLALIDWYALRRAGVASGISNVAWWAWGSLVVAAFAAALASLTRTHAARIATAVLLPAAATLGVVTVCGAPWSLAIGFALVAAAVTAATGRVAERWDGLVPWLRVEAARLWRVEAMRVWRIEGTLVWIAGAIAAAVAAAEPGSFAEALVAATSVLSLGIAPAFAARRGTATAHVVGAAVAAGTLLGAVITLCAPAFGPAALLATAALLAVVAILAAGWAPSPWREGCTGAGVAALAPGASWAGVAVVISATAPLAWLSSPWAGRSTATARAVFAGPETGHELPIGRLSIVVLVAIASACVAAATTFGGRRRLVSAAAGALAALVGVVGAVVVTPIVTGATAGLAAALTVAASCSLLIASAVVGRTRARLAHCVAVVAALPTLPAVGWCAISEVTTCVALAAGVVVAVVATVIGRAEPLRTVHLAIAGAATISFVGLTFAAMGSSVAVVGFATGVVAVTVAVAGAVWRRGSPRGTGLEAVGASACVVAIAFASIDVVWLAVTFTVAVPLLTVATFERERRTRYGIAATASALGATWAWLAAAGVGVLEAYTLPAAAAALMIGELALARRPSRSLLTIGPAITLALGPSLAFAVRDDDVLRAVLCGIAASVLVLVGARRRLQAPVLLGSAALITLGIDTLGPAASRLPRWAALAIPGVVLLWIGSTFERRREAMREAAQRFTEFV